MDLIAKSAFAVLILVAIAAVIFLAVQLLHYSQKPYISSAQAANAVLNDIRQNYPDSFASVLSVSKSNITNDSWDVVVNVVYNYTTPCPEVLNEGYDYPSFEFVGSEYNLYASACNVYGYANAPTYIVGSPYIAITRAYASGNETVRNYIGTYGFNSTTVHAHFYAAPPSNKSLDAIAAGRNDTWIITYTGNKAAKSLYVGMSQNGTIISTLELNDSATASQNSTGYPA
ncbi:hypothetical protein M1373_03650 [Candidatus Marsarchaeota archaeon]|nr:hypothetical protein [Candidatus Marsarchaeota archaeon]MCL5405014.1 hypothetical protein [Candidatus Marsarchaeota archaeon]